MQPGRLPRLNKRVLACSLCGCTEEDACQMYNYRTRKTKGCAWSRYPQICTGCRPSAIERRVAIAVCPQLPAHQPGAVGRSAYPPLKDLLAWAERLAQKEPTCPTQSPSSA